MSQFGSECLMEALSIAAAPWETFFHVVPIRDFGEFFEC